MCVYIMSVACMYFLQVRLQKKARIERRLLAIPLLYLLLRIWGTLQFFYSLGASRYQVGLCVPVNVQKAYAFFGIMQVCMCTQYRHMYVYTV